MLLWTHHPEYLDLSCPNIVLDWEKSSYLKDDCEGFQYRSAYQTLHVITGVTNLLWCCTGRGWYPSCSDRLVEWEIDIPLEKVDWFIDKRSWDQVLKGDGGFAELIVSSRDENYLTSPRVQALIRWPSKYATIRRIGPLPVMHSSDPQEHERATKFYGLGQTRDV